MHCCLQCICVRDVSQQGRPTKPHYDDDDEEEQEEEEEEAVVPMSNNGDGAAADAAAESHIRFTVPALSSQDGPGPVLTVLSESSVHGSRRKKESGREDGGGGGGALIVGVEVVGGVVMEDICLLQVLPAADVVPTL
ncbi:unnamed protein product [Merluccius merluccius]